MEKTNWIRDSNENLWNIDLFNRIYVKNNINKDCYFEVLACGSLSRDEDGERVFCLISPLYYFKNYANALRCLRYIHSAEFNNAYDFWSLFKDTESEII